MPYISLMKKILDNVFVNVGIIYLLVHSKLGDLETFKEAFDYDSLFITTSTTITSMTIIAIDPMSR